MAPFQKRPVSASSAVAVVPPAIPSDLTWSKASLYLSPVNAGATGTKLVRALDGEGSNARPMRELRLLREIRWCRLVVPRGTAENIGDGLGVRTVIVPQGQDPISDGVSDVDAVGLS